MSHEAKKNQRARASSGTHDYYSELFTWMAALKFESTVTIDNIRLQGIGNVHSNTK